MWSAWAFSCLIAIGTLITMELAAMLVHRHVMHGPGWAWHRSHHEPHSELFEKNDLYALLFTGISVCLFIAGDAIPMLWWVGLGMVGYGLCYALLHDMLVHRRIRCPWQPRKGYLKRLVQAHRLHHAVRTKEGAVSFGFLYAPSIETLVRRLRQSSTSS